MAGAVVGVLLGFVSALVEVFWAAAYVGPVRFPVSAVLAVVGNVALVRFTWWVTGSRGLALLPGLAWMVPVVIASGGTSEGDQLLRADNWVALATLFGGAVAWTVAAFRLITGPQRPGVGPLPPRPGRSAAPPPAPR